MIELMVDPQVSSSILDEFSICLATQWPFYGLGIRLVICMLRMVHGLGTYGYKDSHIYI